MICAKEVTQHTRNILMLALSKQALSVLASVHVKSGRLILNVLLAFIVWICLWDPLGLATVCRQSLVAVVAQGHLSPPRAFIFFSAKLRVSLLVAKSSYTLMALINLWEAFQIQRFRTVSGEAYDWHGFSSMSYDCAILCLSFLSNLSFRPWMPP